MIKGQRVVVTGTLRIRDWESGDRAGTTVPYSSRWFFAEVLGGIQDALLTRGLDLTLYDARPGTDGRRRIFEELLARKRFDGLIAVGLKPEDDELRRLAAMNRPMVSIVGIGVGAGVSVVEIDDDDAARRATEHLISLGHRRITFVGGSPDSHLAQVDRRRVNGYAESMSGAGLAAEIHHVPSEVSLPGGYAAAVDILGDPRSRPTAVVATCDEVAIGTMIAARRLGIRVPTDLSVVGIDDHEYAEMFGLTTLEQVPREQGAAAVELLLRQINEPQHPPTSLRLHARLVLRTSTAAPAGSSSEAFRDSLSGGHDGI